MSGPANAAGHAALQVHDDLDYQRRTWRLQRLGWGVFVLMVIAALFGAFGGGPLSRTTAGSPGSGFWAEYERLARADAPFDLAVHVDSALARDGRIHLVLGGDYARAVQLDSLLPRAAGGGATADGAVLSFDAVDGSGELTFVLTMKFPRAGLVRGRVAVAGRAPLELRHWVYP